MTLALRAHTRDHRDTPAAHHLHLCAFVGSDARSLDICHNSDANMLPFGSQFWLDLLDELVIADSLERVVEQRLVVAAVVYERDKILVDDFIVVGKFIRRDKVTPADLSAVDTKLFCGEVQHALDNEHAMLPSRPAIRSDDRLVGKHRGELAVVVLDIVQSKHVGLRVEWHGQTVRGIGACVMQEDIVDAQDSTVSVECDFGIVELSTLVGGGDEILGAILDPLDGPVQTHRCPGNEHFLLVEHHDLGTKPTTNERRNDAHIPLRKPQHVRQTIADHDRRLRGIPDGQSP